MNRALAKLKLPGHETEAYKYFVGSGIHKLVERAIPESRRTAETLAELEEIFRADYATHLNETTRLYDGISELLDRLTTLKIKLAILSNKPDDFTHQAVETFLGRWTFACVLGASDNRPVKPSPNGALFVARQIDASPDLIVYVGDTGIDMETAVAAGMYPVGALWGFRGADELTAAGARKLIETPMDLIKIIALHNQS